MKDIKRQTKQQDERKQRSTERVPWFFGLEIKDLVSPITIRRIRLLQFALIIMGLVMAAYLIWNNYLRAPSGPELIDAMVESAGGMEAWNNIKSGQFTRTQRLYDQAGNALSEQVETFIFRKTNEGVDLMVKATDKTGNPVVISKDGDGFWATKSDLPADPKITSGDLGMMCDSKHCQPSCKMDMAFYRFSMPFKLTDYGVVSQVSSASGISQLDWNPLENIDLERDPEVVDISFLPEIGRDKWRFMVNPETKLIHKIEYYNKSDFGTIRPEELYWTEHKTVDGITFSHKWTRYWANGKVMSEHVYSDVQLNNQIDDTYFDRPAHLDWANLD